MTMVLPRYPVSAAQPWDEMVDGRGALRPRWGGLLATLSGLGRETLAQRAAELDRLLTEDGVTGLLPGATPVALRCDPVPMVIGAAEFDQLAAGLAQRARLIEAVLADIYGSQDLLATGALPPALVYANPAFLRPCCDVEGPGPGRRLHLYAAELLRGPDGRWQVVADRTADAAGVAYAVENRRALTRVVPEIFRAYPPQRLEPFFETWQDALQRLAPDGTEQPSVALLTPGANDKLWFEHVVLARELSCALVEGSDLTVRDSALYLKTLRGLHRIDVLLRRQDGRTLDPLELEPRPRLGVTGLLDATRAGTVRIVNDPGAGCIEAPAFAGFLPRLAPELIGEELALPCVPSLWLGDPEALAEVMADPEAWRFRSALDGTVPQLSPARLAADERANLLARIAAAPADFVATAIVPPSLAPCAGSAGFEPRPLVLRMFLIFDGEAWRAFPGGFARVLTGQDLASGKLPLHALCKDVWVTAEEDRDLIGPAMVRVPAPPVRRSPGDLPSRTADNFYWLGRNLERLESFGRLLRMALNRLERPGPSPRESAALRSLVRCLVTAGLIGGEGADGLSPAALGRELLAVARADAELPFLLSEVSRLAELLRDRLTPEVYGAVMAGLTGLTEGLAKLRVADAAPRDLQPVCTAILTFAATVAGLAAENMVRSGGRLFLELGRRMERAWSTARVMACMLSQEGADKQPGRLEPGLRLALELCDSIITYRNRYVTTLQVAPVIDLVVGDEGNPRATAFQVARMHETLAELDDSPNPALALEAGALLRQVQELAGTVWRISEQEAAVLLPRSLRAIEKAIEALSSQITRQYFTVLPPILGVGIGSELAELRGMA